MKLSQLVSTLGPLFLEKTIADMRAVDPESPMAMLMAEHGLDVINGLSDSLLSKEKHVDVQGKSRFVAHVAADLLRGWPGEPSTQSAVMAVRIAKTLADEAERVCNASVQG